MTRGRRLALAALGAASLMATGLAGCARRGEDAFLLARLRPAAAADLPEARSVWARSGEARVLLRRRNRLRVGNSERVAVVTQEGLSWSGRIPDGPSGEKAGLEVALAALGNPGEPRASRAVLELVTEAGRRPLLEIDLRPADLWVHRRIELPEGPPGRRLVLRSSGDFPVAWAEAHLDRPGGSDRPDIVMVIVDTLRADHLSCYGYGRATTPRLDRLAGESYLFAESFSASTWTLPSTASLLTGLFPDQHGVRNLPDTLAGSALTLAERLRAAGYRTAAFTDGGFVDPQWGFSQGFDRYDSTRGQAWGPKDVRKVSEAATRWIEENRFSPYFLLVHTYEAHQPYVNRGGFADPFLPEGPKPKNERVALSFPAKLEPAKLARTVALYDGEIRRADHYLGRFLDALRKQRRWRRTAVVVTSDHGEEFQEHGNLEHGFGKVYDENVKVPLLLRPPGGVNGARVATPASGVDVLPTVLALAGLAEDPELPGTSLLALAERGPEGRRRRDVLVHGLNSFAELRESRYRLDIGSRSLVFDRIRDRARVFDRERDPGMLAPRPARADGWDGPLVERLQSALAWFSAGPLAVRLPAEADGLVVPRGSRLAPLGAWDGLEWRSAPAALPARGWSLPLTPGRPHCLVFGLNLADGRGEPEIRLSRPGGLRPETVRLALRGGGNFALLHGPLPPLRAVFAASAIARAGSTRLTEEGLAELRALGYVR